MSKTIKVKKEIELPAPPEKYYFIPHREEGITIRAGDLLRNDNEGSSWCGWPHLAGVKLNPNDYLARLRPHNPQGLSDEILAQLPDKAHFLSKEEDEKLKQLGGLKACDKNLLCWCGDEWACGNFGNAIRLTYASYHPEGHYLTLDESEFRNSEQKPEAPTPPEGFELVTDPDYVCQEGDMVWVAVCNKWDMAKGMVGYKAVKNCPYFATPIKKKLVEWTFETRPAKARWFREKGREFDAMVAERWLRNTVVIHPNCQPTYAELLQRYEWSPDGKDNWQECGTEVEA